MLTRLSIENYRGFKTFRMDGLARVNLLVGKNNSGKTAILEGIQFLTSRGDAAVLAEVAERRGEVVVTRPEQSVLVDIAHFFHGHAMGPDASFSFVGDNDYSFITVKAFFVPKEGRADTDEPAARRRIPGLFMKITSPPRSKRDEPRFRVSAEGGVDLELPSRFRRFPSARRSPTPQMRFVGPDSLNSTSNAQVFATTHRWDCIEGLSVLCQREPELLKQVAIHKIDRALPNSVGFSGESLVRMIKSDIDPR